MEDMQLLQCSVSADIFYGFVKCLILLILLSLILNFLTVKKYYSNTAVYVILIIFNYIYIYILQIISVL